MKRKALKPVGGTREAFEKWAKTFPNYIDITRFENGYSDSDTNYAWVAWQAALAQPAQELAIPSTQDAASKVGPFWQEFSVVYEAIGKQQITIREIAWRCFLAAKMTTQPAQEPVAGTKTWFEDGKVVTQYLTAKDIYKEPAQEPVDWEQIYWDMVNAMLRDKLRAQPALEPKSVTYNEVADSMNALRKGNSAQKSCAEEVGKLKLYTAPPQHPWVGLTDEEICKCAGIDGADTWFFETAYALEAKLKEKNT